MKAKAVVRFKFHSKKHLEIVFKALEPEIKKPATTRSKANLERDATFLVLKVEARDTVALRATLNTYLRLINSMTNVLDILENA